MIRAMHNHDTSFKTLVRFLNDNIKKIPFNGSPELQLCNAEGGRNIVWASTQSLASDIGELTKKINKTNGLDDGLLPQIIIARSPSINPSQFGRDAMKFRMMRSVKLVNKLDENDTMTLAGQWFEYETPIQIVILARSQFTAKELSLHVLNILANNSKLNYGVLMTSIEDPAKSYLLSDLGEFTLANVKSASFSESTVQMSGVVAIGAEINMREQFFMFEDYNDIVTKYTISSPYGADMSVTG
ncbi:MAG: hypothetical protein ACWGHH_06605 [Sulfurovaceae bacterium]